MLFLLKLGVKIEIANEDDRQQYQEIELIPSPTFKTLVENIYLDTEIVEDSEPSDDMPNTPLYEHQQDVVHDSEEEEMDSIEVVNVVKGLTDNQIGQTVTNHSIEFQKRQLKPLCDMLTISNISTVQNSVVGMYLLSSV